MVRKLSLVRFAVVSAVIAGAVSANAVTFGNVQIESPPLSDGSSHSIIGNSISFFLPNAIVGDVTDPMRAQTLNIQFDAFSDVDMVADTATVNLETALLGSGVVVFLEQIFELDGAGNEVGGGPIGTAFHIFNTQNSPNFSTTIEFSRPVNALRAKKSFTLLAEDTDVNDLAAVGFVNQNIHVVPEPATMGALGLGAVALFARRRRK